MYFNGLLLLSAQFVRIAIVIGQNIMDPGVLCLSAPRADRNRDPIGDVAWCYTLSQRTACRSQPPRSQIWLCTPFFVSAHRVQIATLQSRPAPPSTADTLSQRTACRSQRQMCTKHRVRICGMRCESVDSFSQHEDLLRADYFPELFCYQSSLCCH